MNEKNFYISIRLSLFNGKIKPLQFNGIDAIMDEWNKRQLTDMRWLAYILATVFHETAKTMQPIEEYGKGRNRTYGHRVKHSGKPYTDTQNIFYGRGFVQLTWYENYQRFSKLLGVDLINHPELSLDLKISTQILFEGMTRGVSRVGDFTGKSLEDYFNDKKEDWVNARRIINGVDCAVIIASYAKDFYKALKS